MYTGRHFVRERVVRCGEYLEADIYPVWQGRGQRRARCRPTSEVQERLNQRNAERRLLRLLHANFKRGDLVMHLTYRDPPPGKAEAQRHIRAYLARVRRRYRREGIELRYVLSTEYGERSGRIHHHLVLSGGVDRDELEMMWGWGYANAHRLQWRREGLQALAGYIAKPKRRKQPKGAVDPCELVYKRWSGSRNLRRPEPEVRDGAITVADARALAAQVEEGRAAQALEARYPGYSLVEASAERNPVTGGAYIRCTLVRMGGGPCAWV